MEKDFFNLFTEELQDIYDSEKRINEVLPKLIDLASLPDLKEALTHHLNESKDQVVRLEKIFTLLNLTPSAKTCEGMVGILKEGDALLANRSKSPVLDAAIISAAQKVEHYEIASYGTLRSFASFLGLDSEVTDLIQEILDEEGNADSALTKIAEGSFFAEGINQQAAKIA